MASKIRHLIEDKDKPPSAIGVASIAEGVQYRIVSYIYSITKSQPRSWSWSRIELISPSKRSLTRVWKAASYSSHKSPLYFTRDTPNGRKGRLVTDELGLNKVYGSDADPLPLQADVIAISEVLSEQRTNNEPSRPKWLHRFLWDHCTTHHNTGRGLIFTLNRTS